MNLHLSGHHLEVTPAIRDYVTAKLERVTRHFDHVIDVNVVLSVDKLQQHVAANLRESDKQPKRIYLLFGIPPDPLLERHTSAEFAETLAGPNNVVH